MNDDKANSQKSVSDAGDAETKSGRERRRFERASFDKTVSIFHRGQFGVERARDISEGGLLLVATRGYLKDEILEISLEVTGVKLHAVIVQVCYVFSIEGRVYVGVRFLDTNGRLSQLAQEIREFVSEPRK